MSSGPSGPHEEAQSAQSFGVRREVMWFSLIFLLAVILRVYQLGYGGFWQDEVQVLIKSSHLHAVLTQGEFVSNNPPLFAILVAGWRAMVGESEFAVRFLTVLIGLGSIGVVYWITRHFFGVGPALITAFIVAVSPMHVLHSQDLKDYILLYLTGPLAVFCLYRATLANTVGWWTAYGVTAAIAVYSEFFSGPLLLAANIWFLLMVRQYPGRIKGWFVANLLGALSFAPQLLIALDAARTILIDTTYWWLPAPTPMSVLFYIKALAFGYSDLKPHFYLAMVVFCLLSAIGAWLAFRRDKTLTLLLALWFVLPVALAYVVSHFTQSIFLIRALMVYAVPLHMFCGLAVYHLRPRLLQAAGVAWLGLMAAFPLHQYYNGVYTDEDFPHRPGVHPPRPYDEAAEYVLERFEEGDVVIHGSLSTWPAFYWYGFQEMPSYFAGVRPDFFHVMFLGNIPLSDREEFEGVIAQHVQPLIEERDRVWYVFSDFERRHLGANPLEVWRWFDVRYPEVDRQDFGTDITVYLYDRNQADEPIRVVERDADTGVTAELRYAGREAMEYTTMRPDTGLRPAPPEERAGNLLVEWEDGAAAREQAGWGPAQVDDMVAELDGVRSIEFFAISNRSAEAVECRVEAVESDFVVNLAALYDAQPNEEGWRPWPLVFEDWTPSHYPYRLVHQIHHPEDSDGTYELYGAASLPQGAYLPSLFATGAPGDVARRNADVTLTVDGESLLDGLPADDPALGGWRWLYGAPLRVSGDGEIPINVVSRANPETDQSWYSMGHLALQRMDGPGGADAPGPGVHERSVEPGLLTIPPYETVVVPFALYHGRLDVWVYEQGPDGRDYHIFREVE